MKGSTFNLPDFSSSISTRFFSLLLLFLALLFSGWMALHIAPAQAQPPATWCESPGQSDIPAAECQALEDLYLSTAGDSWMNNDGWLDSTAVCTDWHGVTCDSGHVVMLDLNTNILTGPLPATLSNLSALISLDLTGNLLNGSIPTSLGSLSNLTALLLGGNQLEGAIPTELDQLSALISLDLGRNKLSGTIPAGFGLLTNLTGYMYLDGNQLEGPIPAGICSLNLLPSNVDYNKLDVSNLSPASCDNVFGDWRATQTVPPINIAANEVVMSSVQDAAAVSANVTVSWLPIAYTEDGGWYEVLTRDTISNNVSSRGTTETSGGKTAESLQVTIPGDPTKFAYFVRTFTPAHDGNQNDLTSVDSEEALIDPNAIEIQEFEAATPLLYLPALAPLLLLILTGAVAVVVSRKQEVRSQGE